MVHIRQAIFAAAVCMLGTGASADIDILSVTFNCENNTQVPVSYFNASDGQGAAAMLLEDQLIPMKQVQSGSGIRYESVGGAGTYTLRSKGWEATISHQADGDTAPERVLFRDCTSR
ncbi:Membrane-bound inhibitor of C-type lysozyme [Ruegeria halocynthiae]|uniref:Membrane-bound inhibitor of C-type lysozyme n=1 Tax=Ruegeria halocynthiae TaxID=985054 RepID=A0A1H2TPP2_9RHOB|nr:MliC family protein [Ruegeria halocynthiae]SDW45747.1 Membrane-bound inhibitor of C-type lysozyme [Ruegeria halocynthiae]